MLVAWTAQLMHQIRASDFLQQNPAHGPSLFEVAAQQGSHAVCGLEDDLVAGTSLVQPRPPGATEKGEEGGESLEDLAKQLVMQLRAGGDEVLEFTAAQGHIVEGMRHAGDGSEGMPQGDTRGVEEKNRKPALSDALGAILSHLDSAEAAHDEPRRGMDWKDCGCGGSDDKLVEAFEAMAPTVDALLADLSGAYAPVLVQSGQSGQPAGTESVMTSARSSEEAWGCADESGGLADLLEDLKRGNFQVSVAESSGSSLLRSLPWRENGE